MILYLLRHAEAEDLVTTDSARPLTEKGRAQAARVGDYCQTHRLDFDLIITSPVLRAADTARLVGGKFIDVPILIEPRLACGMRAEEGLEIVREHARFENILLVGHQPDLGELAAHLLSRDESLQVHFCKAALLSMHFRTIRPGAASLEFFLPAKMLPVE